MKVRYSNLFDRGVLRFLKTKHLKLTFFLIQISLDMSEGRFSLMQKKVEQYRSLNQISKQPSKSLTQSVIETQMAQLDLISSIFMYLEEFLVYSHNLDKSRQSIFVDFANSIASRNLNVITLEIAKLKKMRNSVTKIKHYILMDDAKNIKNVNTKEKIIINRKINDLAKEVDLKIKHVTGFYDSHIRIYNKFKHTLTAILGLHDTVQGPIIQDPRFGPIRRSTIFSSILIRDYEKGKTNTFMLRVGLSSLEYYQTILDDLRDLHNLMLIVYLNYIANDCGQFLIPLQKNQESERQSWNAIMNKVNKNIITKPSYQMIADFKLHNRNRLDKELDAKAIKLFKYDILK